MRRVAWNLDSGTFSKWGASSSLWAIYMWRKLHESIEKRSHKVCYCGKLRRSAKVFSGWLRRAVLHVILCYPGLAILSAIESSEISTPSLQIRNHTNSCCLQILLSDILGASVLVLEPARRCCSAAHWQRIRAWPVFQHRHLPLSPRLLLAARFICRL